MEFRQRDFGKRPSRLNPFGGKARKEHDENTRMQEQIRQQYGSNANTDNPVNAPIEPRHIEEQGAIQAQQDQRATSDLKLAMEKSWDFLKGGFKTIDLIARESNSIEEALQSMQESFPQIEKEEAIKLLTEARNGHARERMMEQAKYPNMAAERGDDPKEIAMQHPSYNVPPFRQRDSSKRAKMRPKPVEIANIMDSPERIRELNPNAQNLVGGDQTPQPQQDPNPFDLSMDKLKESQGGE